MLKIRLKRVGRKNDPSFRVVVIDSRRGPKSNNFVERVGFYNPKTKERELKGDRITYWIGEGAQVSDTVHNMLVAEKIIDGKKKNVLPQKSPVVKEEEAKEVAKAPVVEGDVAPSEDDKPEEEAPKAAEDKKEEEPKAEDKPVEEKVPEPDTEKEEKAE